MSPAILLPLVGIYVAYMTTPLQDVQLRISMKSYQQLLQMLERANIHGIPMLSTKHLLDKV